MATARISVNVDGEIKRNAQKILSEIGMDLTTAIDLFLRTIVREERIPFDLRTKNAFFEETHRQYIREELAKSIIESDNPETIWLSHDEVTNQLKRQRAARTRV